MLSCRLNNHNSAFLVRDTHTNLQFDEQVIRVSKVYFCLICMAQDCRTSSYVPNQDLHNWKIVPTITKKMRGISKAAWGLSNGTSNELPIMYLCPSWFLCMMVIYPSNSSFHLCYTMNDDLCCTMMMPLPPNQSSSYLLCIVKSNLDGRMTELLELLSNMLPNISWLDMAAICNAISKPTKWFAIVDKPTKCCAIVDQCGNNEATINHAIGGCGLTRCLTGLHLNVPMKCSEIANPNANNKAERQKMT